MATALAMDSNDDDSGKTKLDAELKLFSSVTDSTPNTTLPFSYKYVKHLLWRVYENRPQDQLQNLCNALKFHMKYYQDRHQSICEVLYVIDPKTISCDIDAMLKFLTLRTKYKIQFYDLVGNEGAANLLEDNWPTGLERSRYDREFEKVSFLAGGGFGKVFRARNKLDGTVYAMKKVKIHSITIKNLLVHLAEVKPLASLNHINIVPYKAAWLEPLKSSARRRSPNNSNGSSAMNEGEEEEEEKEDDDDDFFHFEDSSGGSGEEEEDYDDDFVLFKGSSGGPAVSAGDENHNQVVKREDPPRGVIVDAKLHLNFKWVILYIQMPLCHLTLRDWLDERNAIEDFDQFYVKFQQQRFCDEQAVSTVTRNAFCRQSSQLTGEIDPRTSDECLLADSDAASRDGSQTEGPVHHLDVVLDVFQQLLNGLNYIHSRGIVHHDIKPSKIFVSRSDHDSVITVQLGDFGLSCSRQSSHGDDGFGTRPYAAPEQLEGKGKSDPKSDIYSLGIILLELLVPFSTDTERVQVIEEVLQGQYPPDLDPEFMELVKNLLQQQPSRRPEMFDLVEVVYRIRINRDKVIAKLRQSLSLQDDEIVSLRTQIDVHLESKKRKEQQLRAKDEEIFKLKEMLRTSQEKEEGNGQSGDANGQETNGAAR